jgi:hypothetical protein
VEAASLLTVAAEGDSARADQTVGIAETAEFEAVARYHGAETKAFPRESS